MDTDVLVTGAGPTGLMLANQLARRGVRVIIIDRHSGPAQQTRAMAVHARTLEIYSRLGIVDAALERGTAATGANIWAGRHRKARVPVGEIGSGLSPYPYILMLGQDENERILGDKLHERDLAVQWNTELVDFEQRSDHVMATLRQPDGTLRQLAASWVAGCDGARSHVRERSGIGFPGAPYEHVFFVADTAAKGNMVPNELNVYLWNEGFHLFFPMRGKDRWRVIGILPRGLRGGRDPAFDDVVPHLRENAGTGLSFEACDWFSTYRIHHRCASRFRDRRCFLLGDAAHIHSPMGGQGMNTGLQDAYNLAWKLALVTRGEADPKLLDTYEAERQPVAQRLLRTTDRAFSLIVADTWIARLFRTRILAAVAAFAMRRERVRKLAFRTLSQIGIRYPGSVLSESMDGLVEGAPRAGDRFPWLRLRLQEDGPAEDLFGKLDDTRFTLITFGQLAPVAMEHSRLVRTLAIPADSANDAELARAQIAVPSFYLLRPDGHIGLAGTRLDGGVVDRHLKRRYLTAGR